MNKKTLKVTENQGVLGLHLQGLAFIIFLAVVIVLFVVAMLKLNLGRIPKSKYINPH